MVIYLLRTTGCLLILAYGLPLAADEPTTEPVSTSPPVESNTLLPAESHETSMPIPLDTFDAAKLRQAWETTVSWHSAITVGPTWSDAAVISNDYFRHHPGFKMPTVETFLPGSQLVTDVVDQKDITVPSNVMYVRFSKRFLEKYFGKSVNQKSPIRDTMLGASVVGTRHTVAVSHLTLLQDSAQARAKLDCTGANHFTTTSHKDGVQVHSRGTTRFKTDSVITFDGEKIDSTPAEVWAETNTTTTGVTSSRPGLRGRIAANIGRREAAATHAQAEAITTERTKQRVVKSFEQRLTHGLAMFTEELKTQYAKLPFEGRFALQEIRCNTTPNTLEMVLIGRGEKEPNFVAAPVFLKGGPDIEFHIHSALVHKAILDPELRQTLQSAVTGLVERPVMTLVAAARDSQRKEPERQLKIHWMEGEGLEWLSLAWHANEDAPSPTMKKPSANDRVTARVRK